MKILIVDDSYSWVKFHKNNLEEIFIEFNISEYEIYTAFSAQEAYDIVIQNNDNPFNLIISDLQMEEKYLPQYAGEWFIEQVKNFKSHLNTKLIISSGCYNIKQIADSLNAICIPKRIAVTNINEYKSIIQHSLELE